MSADSYERIPYAKKQALWNIIEGPWIVHLVLITAVMTVIVPIGWELLASFKTPRGVFEPIYFPQNPSFRAYNEVLFRTGFWKAIVNSAVISTTTTVVVMGLSIPAGYAFSRYRFPFDNAIFILVIFSRLFPPIGIIIPYFQGVSTLGLIDTIPGIIIAQVYLWLPLMIYIMRNFFISIPEALDESAMVDGCTKFQAFRHVVLPLSVPGVAAVGILTFLYSWREFLFSFMISSTLNSRPIAVAVFSYMGEVNISWEQLAAANMLAILPTILVVVFFQRYIVSGLTSGALKE